MRSPSPHARTRLFSCDKKKMLARLLPLFCLSFPFESSFKIKKNGKEERTKKKNKYKQILKLATQNYLFSECTHDTKPLHKRTPSFFFLKMLEKMPDEVAKNI
jgi:hypothetical protein